MFVLKKGRKPKGEWWLDLSWPPVGGKGVRMKPNYVVKGAERYVRGELKAFDEKFMMFRRVMWDMPELAKKLYFTPKKPDPNRPGYTLQDNAFRNATWDLERDFGMGNRGGRQLLLDWDRPPKGEFAPPRGLKVPVDDPIALTRGIKRVARFVGASKVGVCELDRRWVYSHAYYPEIRNPFGGKELTEEEITVGKSELIEIPDEYKYAIVFAIEMNYEMIKYSPSVTSGAGSGLCYSKMPFIAAMVAQYIRGLGYKAIPMGNDTALSIPLAIDAGLGELGRNGVLITPEFGPRVRLSKVFTDLPLSPDMPIEFGVWDFCMICGRCAEKCPSQSISHGEPTTDILNVSNRRGLYRWPVNGETCIAFWERNNSCSCLNCIRYCPFNKPSGLLHECVRWGIKNFRFMNRIFLWGDDAFGYTRKHNPKEFWEN
jgi:reductive dehalogenase